MLQGEPQISLGAWHARKRNARLFTWTTKVGTSSSRSRHAYKSKRPRLYRAVEDAAGGTPNLVFRLFLWSHATRRACFLLLHELLSLFTSRKGALVIFVTQTRFHLTLSRGTLTKLLLLVTIPNTTWLGGNEISNRQIKK